MYIEVLIEWSFYRLVLARHLIFNRFLEVAEKDKSIIFAKWLGF